MRKSNAPSTLKAKRDCVNQNIKCYKQSSLYDTTTTDDRSSEGSSEEFYAVRSTSRILELLAGPGVSKQKYTADENEQLNNFMVSQHNIAPLQNHGMYKAAVLKEQLPLRQTVASPAALKAPFSRLPQDHHQDEGNGNAAVLTPEKIIYNIVWGKPSTKKHKTWEGDGTMEVKGRSVVLKDDAGKVMGRVANVKKEIVLEEGARLVVGGKEVELIELIAVKKTSVSTKPRPASKLEEVPPLKRRRSNGLQTEKEEWYLEMQQPDQHHQVGSRKD